MVCLRYQYVLYYLFNYFLLRLFKIKIPTDSYLLMMHSNHYLQSNTCSMFYPRQKKKICVFPVTRPTLIFPSDPKVFIGIPKK